MAPRHGDHVTAFEFSKTLQPFPSHNKITRDTYLLQKKSISCRVLVKMAGTLVLIFMLNIHFCHVPELYLLSSCCGQYRNFDLPLFILNLISFGLFYYSLLHLLNQVKKKSHWGNYLFYKWAVAENLNTKDNRHWLKLEGNHAIITQNQNWNKNLIKSKNTPSVIINIYLCNIISINYYY